MKGYFIHLNQRWHCIFLGYYIAQLLTVHIFDQILQTECYREAFNLSEDTQSKVFFYIISFRVNLKLSVLLSGSGQIFSNNQMLLKNRFYNNWGITLPTTFKQQFLQYVSEDHSDTAYYYLNTTIPWLNTVQFNQGPLPYNKFHFTQTAKWLKTMYTNLEQETMWPKYSLNLCFT